MVMSDTGMVSPMSEALDPLTTPPCRNLAESTPELREDLRFVPQRDRSGEFWMRVELTEQVRFFRIGLLEYELLSRFDGRHSVEAARNEAIAANQATPGRQANHFTRAQAESVVLWASEEGLFKATRNHDSRARGRNRSSPMWIRIPLTRGGPKLDQLARYTGWFFSRWAGLLVVIAWLAAIAVVVSDWERFLDNAATLFSPMGWLRLAVVWLALKIAHETGHAVCCRRFGGRVGQIGIAWMVVAPVAYVDLTDAYRIRCRYARMMTSLAGVYVELTIAAMAALLWSQSSSPPLQALLTTIVITAGVSSVLFNLNPLMRLDGYYVLTDWLGRPNLAADAAKAVKEMVGWCFLGRWSQHRSLDAGSRVWLLLYGIAAGAYRVGLVGGLLLAGVKMYGRGGLLLAAIIVIGWVLRPMCRAIRLTRETIDRRPAAAIRFLIASAIVSVIGWGLTWIPITSDHYVGSSWLGVAEFQHDAPLRTKSAGFVREIFVADGQSVHRGTPIVRMENLALQAQRMAAQQEWATAKVEERRHREHNQTGRAAAQRKAVRALEKRLQELQEKEAALMVHAPRDGVVVASQLEHWQDRWLEAGEAICHLVQPQKMKAIVAIPQQQNRELAGLVGRVVRVDCGKGHHVLGRIDAIPSRASLKPPHPALAASAGGWFATRPRPRDEKQAAELLAPHLRLEVQIEKPPAWLKAGQPVHVYRGPLSEAIRPLQESSGYPASH